MQYNPPMENDMVDVFSLNSSSKRGQRKPQFDLRNPLKLAQEVTNDESNSKSSNNNEENLLLEQDIEGSRPKERRNRVRLDYDSDSSDDGQTRREKEYAEKIKEKAKADNDSGDDDMFSDSDDGAKDHSNTDNDNSTKGGSIKLLNMDDFEKQSGLEVNEESIKGKEVSSLNYEDDGDDDNEEEITEQNVDIDYFVNPDDAEVHSVSRRTKTHEPKLEAFHLRSDMEDGNFDADGNFIRNATDSSAHQDQWLEGLSRSQINKARLAHAQREAEENSGESKHSFQPISSLMINLVELLDMGESPLEALQRLNSQKKKLGKSRASRFRKKGDVIPTENHEDLVKEAKRKDSIETISHLADTLLQRGVAAIYEMSREELLREYQKQTGEVYTLKRKRSESPENSKQDIHPVEWEFLWEGSDELHGPYDAPTMKSWVAHDYFDARVKVRQVGTKEFFPFDQVEYS